MTIKTIMQQHILVALLASAAFCNAETKDHDKKLSPKDAHYVAQPQNPNLPTLFIIGDSTVRNGNGTGNGGQWGWGDFLSAYFNTNQINVVNNALGGTSTRTFYRDRWPSIKSMIKPGDFVIMQFGHNDASPINEEVADSKARSRGTIDGISPETQSITNILTGRFEVVHSYGWYMEQFVQETRTRNATPIICSLIPRNDWNENLIKRNHTYAEWAAQTARTTQTPFLNIHEIISNHYDQLGQENVNLLFVPGAGPHTSMAGAQTNANCVVKALILLPENPLEPYLTQTETPNPEK